eukprot:TRINITY_DN34485_c0_g1_i1.p2 TRINITY_DN34485_c0_g1~~TRINITY_DN34485_c0_g1_i1.p2  ORF type:complete len:105 (-),score=13.69 TRINITY_DN34485_c0_g1_i1:437-718(-)
MFGSSGPTAQEQAMMEVMEVKSVEDSLNMYNGLVENCFKTCVFNFKIRSLDSRESVCVQRCVQKFLKHSARVSQRFQEQNLLNEQGAAPTPSS